jgi:2-polyprenyl-3-methyl-5-hydroxy-6-metoxy-1,4-benzoquinol methylase
MGVGSAARWRLQAKQDKTNIRKTIKNTRLIYRYTIPTPKKLHNRWIKNSSSIYAILNHMDDYFYPDVNDRLTASQIRKYEPFEGYWNQSEQYVLNYVKRKIRTKTPKTSSSMLDAGCGQGRLIFEFQHFFETIHAIEPDVKRLEQAKEKVRSSKLTAQVSFEAISIEELGEDQKFDMILCSHIIQHVHTDQLVIIFEKFKNVLKDNGLLVILTCHSGKKHDYYIKQWPENSKVLQEVISKEEFNRLTMNKMGILPHHYFSMRNLIQMLEDVNLKEIKTMSFHIMENLYGIDHFINRDKFINTFPCLKNRFGKDMMVLSENIRYAEEKNYE